MHQGFDLNSVDAAAATTHGHHQHHPWSPPHSLQLQLQDIRYLNMLPLHQSITDRYAPSCNDGDDVLLCGKMQNSCAAAAAAGESRQQQQQPNSSCCSSSAGGSGGGAQGSSSSSGAEEEEEGWGRAGGGEVKNSKKAATSSRKNPGRMKVNMVAVEKEEEEERRLRLEEEEAGIREAGGGRNVNNNSCSTTTNNKYVRYSKEQVEALERVYRQCPKPSLQQRLELLRQFPAPCASVDPHQIKVWFQNRRCREKQRKESARLQTLNGKLTAMNTMLMDENLQLQQHVAHLLHQNHLLRHHLHLHKTTPVSLHDNINHLHAAAAAAAGSPHDHHIGHHTTTSLFSSPHILNLSRQSPSNS